MSMGSRFRKLLVVKIGVMTLLAAGSVLVVQLRDHDTAADSAREPLVGADARTVRVVVRSGGFSVGRPVGLVAEREGSSVTMRDKDKGLVVTAGPVTSGSLKSVGKAFVRAMERDYTSVDVLGSEDLTVDGRPALATYGQAVNARDVPIRFVNLVVSARPRNYAINSFAGLTTDPRIVLPQVNAIVNTFTITD